MYRILIVDDDKKLLEELKISLETDGFHVETSDNALSGIVKVKDDYWDLVLLDYYMGDMDGCTFLDIVSEFGTKPRVAIFTSRPSEEVELEILNRGVEDYIRKTEDSRILTNRIKKILNNGSARVERLISTKYNMELNLEFRSLVKDGEEIVLTNTEFEILALLLRNKNKTLTRDRIYESVWASKNKFLDELRTIDVHVLNLRKKLVNDGIVSRKGIGYIWDEK